MKKLFFVILSLFLFNSFLYAADFKEGLWEMSVKMSAKGMPIPMPAQKFKQCITKEKIIPNGEAEKDKEMKCKTVEQKIIRNSIQWKVVCKDESGETIITGKGTYKHDKFDGETKIKSPDGMEIHQVMTGKWVGKCK